jgi:hypothetical protein
VDRYTGHGRYTAEFYKKNKLKSTLSDICKASPFHVLNVPAFVTGNPHIIKTYSNQGIHASTGMTFCVDDSLWLAYLNNNFILIAAGVAGE